MNNPQAADLSYPEFTAVQTRYSLASLNLLFVLSAGALMYFYAGAGTETDGANTDLLAALIRVFCPFAAAIAGCAWFFAWRQLRQENAE